MKWVTCEKHLKYYGKLLKAKFCCKLSWHFISNIGQEKKLFAKKKKKKNKETKTIKWYVFGKKLFLKKLHV